MSVRRLEAALGHGFSRPELLRQALTHRSFAGTNNEQLEFLGDSVLDCAVSASLCLRFPGLKEGDLSRLRANLVRQESLAEIALGLELGGYLRLGEGEVKSGGARRPSILADALEALIHAQEFEVECEVPELGVRGTGIGASRRIAEQQAADRAIAAIGK